ncbi:hypothetical protein B0T14DRAFT_509718 [Immersiella caudata]|uniref:Cytochrome c oxidase subunit 8, mitochondrial n=1 Tax=Immersiella caudata TaxID=314043 RepID=A0AA40C5W8_9PEZI|nr:hypothetical protein B0T14DRAFT_509718 [Immersiella caudata]
MLARAVTRAAPAQRQIVARRGFQTTRAQMSSPYHYPEGPYSNLPFNTKTKFFAFRYWAFMTTGFALPFGIAGASILILVWEGVPVGFDRRAWERRNRSGERGSEEGRGGMREDMLTSNSLADVPPAFVNSRIQHRDGGKMEGLKGWCVHDRRCIEELGIGEATGERWALYMIRTDRSSSTQCFLSDCVGYELCAESACMCDEVNERIGVN